MKILDRPEIVSQDLFNVCVDGIADIAFKERFMKARDEIFSGFVDYETKALKAKLSSIAACSWGDGSQIIIDPVTKADFNALYTTFFADKDSPGRPFYDSIKMLAPLGKCPYCGFGQVTTLDHFLAKSRYPALSILPTNLVPSCSDCNKGKGSSVLSAASQGLHPYFEASIVETDLWLQAKVIEAVPLNVDYLILHPVGWSDDLSHRLSNHFEDFSLADRYSIEAATELVRLVYLLDDLDDIEDRRAHLVWVAKNERKFRPNTWKAALYSALQDCEWYIDGGYRLAHR
jgi:hypothetical protein